MWAKRNTHSEPPPHPSGAKKVAATSPFLTPTQKEGGGGYLFSDTRKMLDLIVVPFKPFSVTGNQYEEYWNAEHLHVCAMFPSASVKDRIQIVQRKGGG